MARILNKAAGKIVKQYNDLTRDTSGVLTGPLNKLWRSMILVNRRSPRLPKDQALKGKLYNPNEVITESTISYKDPRLNNDQHQKWRMQLKYPIIDEVAEAVDPGKGNKARTNFYNFRISRENQISNQIIIVNLEANPIQRIILQNRPGQVDFRGETTWAAIKSMGRNTPMYHYVGSEDIIQFNISWYCNDPNNPEEVLAKCRLLESWTKSNGYQSSPPTLKIDWGSSGLFEGHQYILTSATYTLQNFQNSSRQRIPGQSAIIRDGKLLPARATQELIFKRVSAYNLANKDIINPDILRRTKGIEGF